MLCDFQQSHTQGPDVGSDGIRLSSNSFRCHVVGGTNKSIGVAFGAELAADTEVAEFDLTITAEEDIGRFDI